MPRVIALGSGGGESCDRNSVLVGRILYDEVVHKGAIIGVLNIAWNDVRVTEITKIGRNLFTFEFKEKKWLT